MSLYPEGEYAAHAPLEAGDDAVEATDPASTKDADSHRRRMRAAVAKSMQEGALSPIPEETVGASAAEPQATAPRALQASRPTAAKRSERGKGKPARVQAKDLAEEDDFFAR